MSSINDLNTDHHNCLYFDLFQELEGAGWRVHTLSDEHPCKYCEYEEDDNFVPAPIPWNELIK